VSGVIEVGRRGLAELVGGNPRQLVCQGTDAGEFRQLQQRSSLPPRYLIGLGENAGFLLVKVWLCQSQ